MLFSDFPAKVAALHLGNLLITAKAILLHSVQPGIPFKIRLSKTFPLLSINKANKTSTVIVLVLKVYLQCLAIINNLVNHNVSLSIYRPLTLLAKYKSYI